MCITVTPEIDLKPNVSSDRSWVYNVAADVSDGEPQAETLAIRFANAESTIQDSATYVPEGKDTDTLGSSDAKAFKSAFESVQKGNVLDAVEDKKEEKKEDKKEEEAPTATEDKKSEEKKEEPAKAEEKKE